MKLYINGISTNICVRREGIGEYSIVYDTIYEELLFCDNNVQYRITSVCMRSRCR